MLEHPLDLGVPLGAVGGDVALGAQAHLDEQVPDPVVLPHHERLAADEPGGAQVGQEGPQVLEELVAVDRGDGRPLLDPGADPRRVQPVAVHALEVAGVAEAEPDLGRPGQLAVLGREAVVLLELRRLLGVLGLPPAGAAAVREVVGLERLAEHRRPAAPPDVGEALLGDVAERIGVVHAARQHEPERVELERAERGVAGRPEGLVGEVAPLVAAGLELGGDRGEAHVRPTGAPGRRPRRPAGGPRPRRRRPRP